MLIVYILFISLLIKLDVPPSRRSILLVIKPRGTASLQTAVCLLVYVVQNHFNDSPMHVLSSPAVRCSFITSTAICPISLFCPSTMFFIVGCRNQPQLRRDDYNCVTSFHSMALQHTEDGAFKLFKCTFPGFRHRASCIQGQGFHYSPENAFYIFNQQTYFII